MNKPDPASTTELAGAGAARCQRPRGGKTATQSADGVQEPAFLAKGINALWQRLAAGCCCHWPSKTR
ncbi:hypothetical protein [Aeromonas molluscorum]|uniref:hypothetical protein n=1 Tax=Aeromonas molluscorum TaxID=271417 RepID=UPI003F1DE24C